MITEIPEVTAADEQELIRAEDEIDRLTIEIYKVVERSIISRYVTIPDCDGVHRTGPRSIVEYSRRAPIKIADASSLVNNAYKLVEAVYCLNELRAAK